MFSSCQKNAVVSSVQKKKKKIQVFQNKVVKHCSHHRWSVPCSEADSMLGKRTEKAAWCDQTDAPQSPISDDSFLG